MKRALSAVAAFAFALALSGCPGPKSERWEQQLETWPEERPTGATSIELRTYHEAEESFEAMMAAEHATAEH